MFWFAFVFGLVCVVFRLCVCSCLSLLLVGCLWFVVVMFIMLRSSSSLLFLVRVCLLSSLLLLVCVYVCGFVCILCLRLCVFRFVYVVVTCWLLVVGCCSVHHVVSEFVVVAIVVTCYLCL